MRPYNPLEKGNLGRSVAESLMGRDALPLGGIERFSGAGIYVIYYTGSFAPYAPYRKLNPSKDELNVPIYVGKAIPTGGRKGSVDPELSAKGTALFSRLEDHRKSIDQATNLSIEDFWCRYLVVDDIWIPLGENLLIQWFKPVWNSVVDGFGNHDPGKGRYKGARPNWDTIHPGREWAERCAESKFTRSEILLMVKEYWEKRQR